LFVLANGEKEKESEWERERERERLRGFLEAILVSLQLIDFQLID
jgi:hypothetical protein